MAEPVFASRRQAAEPEDYSRFVDEYYPDRVLFGDTHIHTNYSGDAGMAGGTPSPKEAYRPGIR